MTFKHQPDDVRAVIPYIVEECQQLSDAKPDALTHFAHLLVNAHVLCPDGLTIEVGTRAGGSALITAKILDYLYRAPPPFLTIDPYGSKPYLGGDHEPSDILRPYGDPFYCSAKQVLSVYPNHAHYLLESEEFFSRLYGSAMWHRGQRLPFRGSASYVFLDGNHDAGSVIREIDLVQEYWLRPGGTIGIDNARNDPALKQDHRVLFVGREWATVRREV